MKTVLLTSAKAARVLEMHESSVKRWCNEGSLPYTTTTGGHRRIALRALLEFARSNGVHAPLSMFGADAERVWLGLTELERDASFESVQTILLEWLIAGDQELPVQLIRHLATRAALPILCDRLIAPMMEEVGHRWATGAISVGTEHRISGIVEQALFTVGETTLAGVVRSDGASRPNAIIGCAEGNDHEIGARCVRLVLEEKGWYVHYLGARVPTREYSILQQQTGAQLVCVSCTPHADNAPSGASRHLDILRDEYDATRPYRLALGGSGAADHATADGHPFAAFGVFRETQEFLEWLGDSHREVTA